MTKAQIDIQKGDEVSFVNYDSKTYILTGSVGFAFTNDSPAKFFKDDGSGDLVDANNDPITSIEVTRVHATTLIVDNEDVILKTDGKIYNAVIN